MSETRLPAVLRLRRALLALIPLALAAMPTASGGAAEFGAGITQYKVFLGEQVARSRDAAATLRDRVAAADLPGAQRAWLEARGGWEATEVVADEFFPELDAAIDAWPDAKHGFHAIEAKLFGAHSTDVLAESEALVANLTAFRQKLDATTLTAQGLLNGATKLAFEIGENKAEGGESPFSGNSLAEIEDNLRGIEAAYRGIFAAALVVEDAALDRTVRTTLDELHAVAAAPDLARLDQTRLRKLSEDLAIALLAAGPAVGLEKPSLEN
jgi:iron uptake system EfeUOB component EfeO/EfeM